MQRLGRNLDYGVPVPLSPEIRSNACTREARLRSEPIAGRISLSTGVDGVCALRSCTLRASSAETATGPKGTNPVNAAGDLPVLSALPERWSCRRSIRRLGGRRWICGSAFGCGEGAATVSRPWETVALGAAATATRSLFLRGTVFFFALLPGVFLDSTGASVRICAARWRRAISASI